MEKIKNTDNKSDAVEFLENGGEVISDEDKISLGEPDAIIEVGDI